MPTQQQIIDAKRAALIKKEEQQGYAAANAKPPAAKKTPKKTGGSSKADPNTDSSQYLQKHSYATAYGADIGAQEKKNRTQAKQINKKRTAKINQEEGKPPPGPAKPPKPTGPPPLTAAQLQAEEAAAIQANPFTQMAESLAAAQNQEVGAVLGELNPQAQTAAMQGADAQALAATGETGNTQSAGWLQGQMNQAQRNDSPMAAAMNAYQQAYAATEPSVTNANVLQGQAAALAEQVAPADAYLNLATSHLGNTNYLQLTGPQAQNLPPALSYYLGQSGVQGLGKAGGTAAVPSAGAVLSGGTATTTPSALNPGTGTAPG